MHYNRTKDSIIKKDKSQMTYAMLLKMVPLNSTGSCGTITTFRCSQRGSIVVISTPSMQTVPLVTS